MYSWEDTAIRTEQVYENALSTGPLPFSDQLRRVYSIGWMSGKIFALVMIFTQWYLMVCEYFYPANSIEIVEDWNLASASACLKKRADDGSVPGYIAVSSTCDGVADGDSDGDCDNRRLSSSSSGETPPRNSRKKRRGRSRTRKRATAAAKTPSPERSDLSMSPVPSRRRNSGKGVR